MGKVRLGKLPGEKVMNKDKSKDTVMVYGREVKSYFFEFIAPRAEIFNIDISGDFIPKLYSEILKDEVVMNILMSEPKEGANIKKAFQQIASESPSFPSAKSLIVFIKLNNNFDPFFH